MAGRHLVSMVSLLALVCLCTGCGPRMVTQVADKPYKSRMPEMPPGTVPVTGRSVSLTKAASTAAINPVPATADIIDDGRVYYGYYCLMCHGEIGDGEGPVGQSYVPRPKNLTAPAVATMTDGQLYYRMLHGSGHDPVMEQTVLPEHRWPLVHYVRRLAKPLQR